MKLSKLKKVTYLNREDRLFIGSILIFNRFQKLNEWIAQKKWLPTDTLKQTRKNILYTCRAARRFTAWDRHLDIQQVTTKVFRKHTKGMPKRLKARLRKALRQPAP